MNAKFLDIWTCVNRRNSSTSILGNTKVNEDKHINHSHAPAVELVSIENADSQGKLVPESNTKAQK